LDLNRNVRNRVRRLKVLVGQEIVTVVSHAGNNRLFIVPVNLSTEGQDSYRLAQATAGKGVKPLN
jgi:hypothetical protein